MNRNIITARDIEREKAPHWRASEELIAGEGEETVVAEVEKPATISGRQPDNYLARLVKYIPPEVIATFIFLEGAIGSAVAPHRAELAWIVFAIILVATPFYLRKAGGIDKPVQIALATVAFVVWAMAYQGPPFGFLQWPSLYTTVLLGLYTFLLPLLVPSPE